MRKFLSLILVVGCLLSMLTGCDALENVFIFDKTNEVEADLPTGDSFEFLITKDSGYTFEENKKTKHYEVVDNSGTMVLDIVFRSESQLKSAVDSNRIDWKVQNDATLSKFAYTIYTHKSEKDTVIVVGWLVGTNTGFIGTTTTTTQKQAIDFFEHWSFNINNTNQSNATYYPDFIG